VRDRVFNYIRKHALMRPGDRVGAAVSGGADSVALLRLLLDARAELGIVLSVVHFNHKIRGADSDSDEQFVRSFARGFDLEFHSASDDTPAYARTHKLSLEAAARKLRYAFFGRLIAASTVHCVATAHTRDDQAETVLLRFLRGSGTRGLAGVHPELRSANGSVVRPLLEVTHAELRLYLEAHSQPWREDASNRDLSYARNRVRHEVLPALRQLNPNLEATLSDTAEIARGEEQYWEEQIRRLLPALMAESAIDSRQSAMSLPALQAQPLALQRRLLRALAEKHGLKLEFRHVEQILSLAGARSPLSTQLELPHGWEAVRHKQELWFRRRCQTEKEPREYDRPLAVPGAVEVAARTIRAALVNQANERRSDTRATRVLLDPALAKGDLRVRNWRAGDRYWPAHTRQPRKLKELLQARHIPREQKPFWPVVVSGEEIVWVPGFAPPEHFRVREAASEALLLEQLPLGQSGGNDR
jgi:tRNA(Ile)-lysidine synthase